MKPVDCDKIYNEARFYDSQTSFQTDDIPFYLDLIKKYGDPVLELACGTGRVTIQIAEQGYNITGLDISEPMVALGKEKAETKDVKIEWIISDVRSFDLKRKFNFIFYPFNSILHLHDNDSYYACFDNVRKHLTDKGRFLLEIFMPSLKILTRDPNEYYGHNEFDHPDFGLVKMCEQTVYDNAKQILSIVWKYEIENGSRSDIHFQLRILFPQEIDAMLEHCGLEIEHKFGRYDKSPFDSDSAKQIIICRKK